MSLDKRERRYKTTMCVCVCSQPSEASMATRWRLQGFLRSKECVHILLIWCLSALGSSKYHLPPPTALNTAWGFGREPQSQKPCRAA